MPVETTPRSDIGAAFSGRRLATAQPKVSEQPLRIKLLTKLAELRRRPTVRDRGDMAELEVAANQKRPRGMFFTREGYVDVEQTLDSNALALLAQQGDERAMLAFEKIRQDHTPKHATEGESTVQRNTLAHIAQRITLFAPGSRSTR